MKIRTIKKYIFAHSIQEGSFTVETTLVMAVVLSVLVAIIFTGYYLHDRCVMAGAAYEGAVWGAHQSRLDNDSADIEGALRQFIGNKTITCSVTEINGSISSSKATTHIAGFAHVPGEGILSGLLRQGSYTLEAEQKCPCPDREEIIRMTRELRRLGGD